MSIDAPLIIDPAYCGPPDMGNGGYVCGLLAERLEGPLCVTLRAPLPLARALRVERAGDGLRVCDGEVVLAEAEPGERLEATPDPVAFARAEAVEATCRGLDNHSYPNCFVCGPERPPGDGLRILPGWVPERSLAAAPWIPDAAFADASGLVRREFLWAALDCPTAFPLLEGEPRLAEPLILGRLRGAVEGRVAAGERCVVIAWRRQLGARKGAAGAALYGERGGCVGAVEGTWISLAGRRPA